MRMRKPLFLIFFLLISFGAYCQKVAGGRHATGPERWWAIKHIFVAHKANCLTKVALAQTQAVAASGILGTDKRGGHLDAFRHAYWMALLAQEIKPWKVTRLGIAHEKGNYKDFTKGLMEDGILPDKISGAMDLYNNQVGVNTGYLNNSLPADSLRSVIISQIMEGKMVIISKDGNGNYLDCNDRIIDLTQYENQWDIPKCLISSGRKD